MWTLKIEVDQYDRMKGSQVAKTNCTALYTIWSTF